MGDPFHTDSQIMSQRRQYQHPNRQNSNKKQNNNKQKKEDDSQGSWWGAFALGALGTAIVAGGAAVAVALATQSDDKEPVPEVRKQSTTRVQPEVINTTSPSTPSSTQPECVVCMEDLLSEYVLIPCGHTGFCSNCITSLDEKCPICREPYTQTQKLFRQ